MQWIGISLFWLLILVFSNSIRANELPSDFVKVTKNIKVACVEYYTYHNELYCSTKATSTATVDPSIKNDETQDIVFDNRIWHIAWGKKTDDVVTVEYVPNGDNIDAWHELITSQRFSALPKNLSAKEIADMEIQNLEKSGFNPQITVFKTSPEMIMFEFRIEQPSAQAQDELQRILIMNGDVYILHYVIKEKDMGSANRDQWIKRLSDSQVKN